MKHAMNQSENRTVRQPWEDRPTAPEDAVRLTSQQEALWFFCELTGHSEAYNESVAIRIRGPVDAPRLERSLRAVVRRQESLRTAVRTADPYPLLSVLDADEAAQRLSLAIVDDPGSDLANRLQQLASRPFDLTRAPLFRAFLIKQPGDEHLLLMVVHHLVFDGWSASVLTSDLATLYIADGDCGAISPLPGSYSEYAEVQRCEATSQTLQEDLEYWTTQLRDLSTFDLPTDRARAAVPSFAGGTVRFDVDSELADALRTIARVHDATLFMTSLAAFQAFLSRYTGCRDIAVGVPTAGRNHDELEPLVGFFVNTLVMRADLSDNPSFDDLLARTRETALDALMHQELPFDRLVAELSPERDLGRNPLYQVSFALQNYPPAVLAIPGLSASPVRVAHDSAKFDLSLTMFDIDGVMTGEFEFAADLFDRQTIERMAGHFTTWLKSIASDPSGRIEQLRLLSDEERRHLIADVNDTRRPGVADTPVPTLFRRQALATPGSVAVAFGDAVVSYEELDRLSDQVAARLEQQGTTGVVGVCMERSIELLVSLLGVLKSGCAFLPLDPNYPDDRLQWMLNDARATRVLTHAPLAGRVSAWRAEPPAHAWQITVVPEQARWSDGGNLAARSCNCDAAQPAYVLYTSGSTGIPKGVVVPHRALSNHEQWFCDALGLDATDRVLQKTSISFDAMVPECFAALLVGGAVVMAPPGAQRDQARVLEEILAKAVTVVQWGPAELRALLDQPLLASCTSLRRIISGGEALERSLAVAVRRVLPHARLGNFYGPTEATVDSAFYLIDGPLPDRPSVPIGRPIANGELHVLDGHMEPVPCGVTGELYVGGLGLASGYLGRDELTAERFVPHPYRVGERLYRTGDLARRGADDLVEYVGRADRQVKLRGQRIELGEIEAVLRNAPHVDEAAVVMREDVPGVRVIVGYVTGTIDDVDALQRGLRTRLPEAMVPGAIVRVPHLPLTTSGKLDRSRLPAPALGHDGRQFVPPRSLAEETLAAIWKSVLNVVSVGAHDDFFALGGHSLNATQVIARVKGHFGVDLPLRVCFEARTVAGMTAEILARRTDAALVSPSAIVRRESRETYPVSFSQRRMWLLQQLEPAGVAYNMRMTVRLKGSLQRPQMLRALDLLVRRHEAFRTTFTMEGREPIAIVGEAADAQVTLVDVSDAPRDEREAALSRALLAIFEVPFDLSHGPLYRIALGRVDAQDHALMLVMHHVIGDDWSFGILRRELETLYNELVGGREPSLPARAIEFSDYAAWQRQVLDDAAFEPDVEHWTEVLRGVSPLDLPTSFGVARRTSSRGASIRAVVDDDRRERLRSFCARHSVSPYMVTLAAFQWVLARYCGQTDIALGTPVANRTRVEAEGVVGSLVNTLIVRTDVDGVTTFAELLARTRQAALLAFDHQDLPYDYLTERVRDIRGGTSEIRVMFNVLNTPNDELKLHGLTSRYMNLAGGSVQFDLALNIDTDVERVIALGYSSELFDRSTAERLLDNYLRVLDRALETPHAPLAAVGLAGATELDTLSRWNATACEVPAPLTVHGRFAEQALRSADSVAIIMSTEGQLTYAQLAERVHRMARVLRTRGIGRGDLVGLYVERGISMVVSQLAILESGAGYVPLDPAYPAARLQYMVEDAGLALLVTQSSLARSIAWPREQALLLDVDTAWTGAEIAAPPDADERRDARPDDPAYVIYTSGSTGKPKGVVVHHGAVVNFLTSMSAEPGLRASDILLAVTTISFDIAVLEILLPLTVGATIVLASREEASDGSALRALLETYGATIMQATPATWRLLVDAQWQGGSRFTALIGGEALPPDLSQQLLARTGEVWNMYGPTETTVWSTCWRVEASDGGISIGRPIANTSVHVLDPAGHQCPIGVAGEIVIGGLGVTTGYLHRQALTRERFIPDPFCSTPGARMYRTGDSGRWRHDGLLEHLGRLDFQVKVRGHRIELGEIESALASHVSVARAVVIVREDRPGDARLVAYIVSKQSPLVPQTLREHLRTSLPAYMLPQHYVELSEIPLLPNGKVNRHALLPPSESVDQDVPALTNEVEQTIAAVWSDLLGVRQVRSSDMFFDLGGHSLLAVRAAMEIERRLGVRIELRRLIFESLGQIAASIPPPGTPNQASDISDVSPVAQPQSVAGWLGYLRSKLAG